MVDGHAYTSVGAATTTTPTATTPTSVLIWPFAPLQGKDNADLYTKHHLISTRALAEKLQPAAPPELMKVVRSLPALGERPRC